MSLPPAFTSVTPRLHLPVLYSGQAQKEFFVNEAFFRLDAITHPVVEGDVAEPPATPVAGRSWLVADDAAGMFKDYTHALAYYDGVQWTFIAPVLGMTVFDRSTSTLRRFANGWSAPESVAAPIGGTTVDVEARQAIVALLQALKGLSLLKHG